MTILKSTVILLSFFLLTGSAFCQQSNYAALRSENMLPLVVKCGIGLSSFHYKDKTNQWLGRHGSPYFNCTLEYFKWNFGISATPWSTFPKKSMIFNDRILPVDVEIGYCKTNIFAGYSIDFDNGISLEPYLGWSLATFSVINSKLYTESPALDDTDGFVAGLKINNYIPVNQLCDLNIFINISYANIDYSRLSRELDNGCTEISVGIGMKMFRTKSNLTLKS